jgi:hypothetical protein
VSEGQEATRRGSSHPSPAQLSGYRRPWCITPKHGRPAPGLVVRPQPAMVRASAPTITTFATLRRISSFSHRGIQRISPDSGWRHTLGG